MSAEVATIRHNHRRILTPLPTDAVGDRREACTWLAVALAALGACGEPPTTPPPPPAAITVRVIPDHVQLEPGDIFHFQAVVEGNGPHEVTWSVEADTPDVPTGNIDADGTWYAPPRSNGPVKVIARSVASGNSAGDAIVELPRYSVAISPADPTPFTGETVQFTAITSGESRPARWTALVGTIDSSGLYHAPEFPSEDFVDLSFASGTYGARVHLSILRRPPVLTAIGSPAAAGESVALAGTGVANSFVYFPRASGESIPVQAGTNGHVIVPVGAVSGEVFVEVPGMPGQGILRSNGVPFERTPRILLRPLPAALVPGETVPLQIAWIGHPDPLTLPVTYDADVGTIDGRTYTAPATASSGVAHLRACVTGTTNCSGTPVLLDDVRIEQPYAIVPAGGTLALSAAPSGASFRSVAGGGILTQDGQYTAPLGPQDTGLQWIVAQSGSSLAAAQIGVTGLQPGLVDRLVDPVDQNYVEPDTGASSGSWVDSVAVAAGKAYVLHRTWRSPVAGFVRPEQVFQRIDVYDVSVPADPLWLEALECPTHATDLYALGTRLYAFGRLDPPVAYPDGSIGYFESLAVFDLSAAHPLLLGQGLFPRNPGGSNWSVSQDAGRLAIVDSGAPQPRKILLRIHEATDVDPLTPRLLALNLPDDAYDMHPWSVAIGGDRIYATYSMVSKSDTSQVIGTGLAVWNIGTGAQLGAEPIDDLALPLFPVTVAGPLVLAGRMVLDGTTVIPVPIGTLPMPSFAVATEGNHALLENLAGTLAVLDFSTVASPRIVASLDGMQTIAVPDRDRAAAWAGNIAYVPQGPAGLGIYDTGPMGGPIPVAALTTSYPGLDSVSLGAILVGHYLYATGVLWDEYPEGSLTSELTVWDVSVQPAKLVWRRPDWPIALFDDNIGYAVGVSGTRLVEARSRNLVLWSIAAPENPVLVTSVPLDASALLVQGSTAWVGTASGDLIAFDLDAPAGLAEIGRVSFAGSVSAIAAAGPAELAVGVWTGSDGDVALVDATDPTQPAIVSRTGLGTPINAVAVAGTTAFATGPIGLVSLDISDPLHIGVLGFKELPVTVPYSEGRARGEGISATIAGGLLWIGTIDVGNPFYGFDVRNPAVPRLVSKGLSVGLYGLGVYGVVMYGDRAFVLGGGMSIEDTGLFEFDLARPGNVITNRRPDARLQLP